MVFILLEVGWDLGKKAEDLLSFQTVFVSSSSKGFFFSSVLVRKQYVS